VSGQRRGRAYVQPRHFGHPGHTRIADGRSGDRPLHKAKREERDGRVHPPERRARANVDESLPASLPPVSFITTVPRAYCASPSENGTYENPGNFRESAPRGCRPCTGALMPTIDRQELDRLERRNLRVLICRSNFHCFADVKIVKRVTSLKRNPFLTL